VVEIPVETMTRWCALPHIGNAYLRPFLVRGPIEENSVFIVGLNPATPIGPAEVSPELYRELVSNYTSFMEYYKAVRLRSNKKRLKSNTRVGIESLGDWIRSITSSFPVETNVVGYPTKDEAELKLVPREVQAQGIQIFQEVIQLLRPRVLVFHGKASLKRVKAVLVRAGLHLSAPLPLNLSIRALEDSSPIACGTWSDGTPATILACRHLKLYGEEGRTFAAFRARLQITLNPNLPPLQAQ
jgi:hypothetical protein